MTACLPICRPPFCLKDFLPVSLSVYVRLRVCLSVCLSVCLTRIWCIMGYSYS